MNNIENIEDKSKIKDKRERIMYEKLSEGVYALSYKTNPTNLKYTKEQIMRFIESNDEAKLREVSNYFFLISGHYRGLIQYYTNVLMYSFLITPKVKDKKTFESAKFKSDFQSVLDYSDNAYIEETCRFVSFNTLLEGVFYGYERMIDGSVILQQLPANYCRSKFKIDGNHAIEFNMRFFDQYKDVDLKISKFKLFPEEFLNLYNQYKQGITNEWVLLDSKYTRCHKFNDSNGKPLLSDLFLDLINLKEYIELDKSQSKLDLYKLIVQTIPVDDKTGEPLIELEEAKALHTNAKKMITQEGIDVLTTALKVEAINLQERGSTVRDNIERANNGLYSAAGTSKILFNGGSDGGSIGLTNSIKVDEGVLFPLIDQYQRWYDTKFKTIIKNKNYKFSIWILKVSRFNMKEMYDMFKEQATLGYSKMLPAIVVGVKQTTFLNQLDYENDYLKLDERMKPLASSHTLSNGRPKVDENNLSDEGLKSRDKQ